ncbi:Uncharacterised protein [Burkholderia pseudomallei]|nr:Uncharacterised protein [Burkholderia pseudomallei]
MTARPSFPSMMMKTLGYRDNLDRRQAMNRLAFAPTLPTKPRMSAPPVHSANRRKPSSATSHGASAARSALLPARQVPWP